MAPGGARKPLTRDEAECDHRCRSRKDAAAVIGAVSKGSDLQSLLFLVLGGACAQPGKVSDALGRTALHVAAAAGKRAVAEWLLRFRDAAINAKDQESGYSALHRAIYYGQVHLAECLVARGANLSLNDMDGLTPLDHLVRDRRVAYDLDLTPNNPCDLYAWGSNANFNLGLGHQQQRVAPDVVEFFRRSDVFCRAVVLQKFHSAFLSSSGQVFTCGHGRGGRLGHDNEESQLSPRQVKAFQGQACKQVALGVDHSVFLLSSGAVWTCGTNAYHQLGQSPSLKQATSPAPVTATWKGGKGGSSKFPAAEGIGASRFHSLFWTKDALYTWGLNAGQLGHIKGDKTVPHPKLVSSLNEKRFSIRLVASSDGAIVVLTEGGEILALHEYQNRRIASKHLDVAKIQVVGGHLDPRVCSHVGGASGMDFGMNKIVERGGQDLKVFVLTNLGRVFVWEEKSGSQLCNCIFSLNREILMADIAVSRSQLLLLSKDGLGYEGTKTAKKGAERKTSAKKSEMTELELFLAKYPTEQIKLKRIPGIFRGTSVACDPKGQNSCILQLQANAALTELPEAPNGEMAVEMETFLEETSVVDLLHDVVFVVEGREFPAHRYIVACSSDQLSNRLVALSGHNKELEVADVQPAIFEQLLKYAYTKTCDILRPGPCAIAYQPPRDHEKDLGCVLSDEKDDDVDENESAFSVAQKKKKKRGKPKSESAEQPPKVDNASNECNAFVAVQEAARSFGFHGLVKALEGFRYQNGVIVKKDPKDRRRPSPVFSRKSFPELHDVVIKTEDGAEGFAHKCILSARLDYFRSMFGLGWSESGGADMTELTLPIGSKVVHVVLEYLYRDEPPSALSASEDPEFVGQVLMVADQFLMPRLIAVCEGLLAQMLSLKNAADILQFSHDLTCTRQIRASAQQFICQNLAAMLESRALSVLDGDALLALTDFYRREFLPGPMSTRVIPQYGAGPSVQTLHEFQAERPDVDEEDILEDELAQLAENKRKQKAQSSSKRRSGRRHSSGDKSPRITSRQRNLSSSSLSSDSGSDGEGRGSSGDDCRARVRRVGSDLSLEDLDFEEKEDASALSFAPPAKSRPDPSAQPANRDSNFLADFFGTSDRQPEATFGFGDAAAHDQGQQQTPSSKKFNKKSQKERKRELLDQQQSKDSCVEVKPKWGGWGADRDVSHAEAAGIRTVQSFSDIMKDQSSSASAPQADPSSPLGAANGSKAKKSQKSSWKQLDLTPATPSSLATSPPPNAWKTWTNGVASATATPNPWRLPSEDGSFRGIQDAQWRRSDTTQRVRSKPLSVTQAEEKAISELRAFYNADNVFDEHITVVRVHNEPLDTPVWKRL